MVVVIDFLLLLLLLLICGRNQRHNIKHCGFNTKRFGRRLNEQFCLGNAKVHVAGVWRRFTNAFFWLSWSLASSSQSRNYFYMNIAFPDGNKLDQVGRMTDLWILMVARKNMKLYTELFHGQKSFSKDRKLFDLNNLSQILKALQLFSSSLSLSTKSFLTEK